MKINKRLSEEFGAPLPSPSIDWEWWVDKASDLIIPTTLAAIVLTIGAIFQSLFHLAVWGFLAVAGIGLSVILVSFFAVSIEEMKERPGQW